MAKLIIQTDDHSGQEVALAPEPLAIGSDAGSDLTVPGSSVGARHATVREENNRWYLRDEGSPWGTFVNGRRVKDQGLQDGDVIELGLGGPTLLFETGEEERERGSATTAGRLKQYYEQAAVEPEPDPPAGAGKIAVPAAARGVLFAVGGAALVALGAFWVGGRTPEVPAGAGGPASPTAFGGPLYPLQRASMGYFENVDRMRVETEREVDGGPRRSRMERDLESVRTSLSAGVEDAELTARRADLEEKLGAGSTLLTQVAPAAAPGLVLVQTGFDVDGHYFPGPTGTGFVLAGGAVVTSRQVVAPDSYIRTSDEAGLACALKDLREAGKAPVKVISIWAAGSTPGFLDHGLDPATADASTSAGTVEEAGFGAPDEPGTRSFGCPAGGLVPSRHVEGSEGDLALLRVSADLGGELPLATRPASESALVLFAGFPRGVLSELAADGLSVWATWGAVVEPGDRLVFEVPVLPGTEGAPLLDTEGRVVGVGVTTQDGRGVALPPARVQALLSGS